MVARCLNNSLQRAAMARVPRHEGGTPLLGRYRFGPDFFRPNATLELTSSEDGLILKWPGGPDAVVVVADDHHFIDRHYWMTSMA